MIRNVYYFDYSPEAYNYIMSSKILRQSEKNILNDIINGKTVRELALKYKCSEMTICRKRKKIYDKTKCLIYYNGPVEKIDEYYKNQIENNIENKLKIYGDEEFKVVKEDTSLYKVYLLTFPNNKVYIGITSQLEKNRWRNGDGYIDNEVMYNDILKYGWINIKKNILYKDLSFEKAREKEKELIINYKSHLKKYGYNRCF